MAIDLVSACERSVLEEDAPGTHECWLVWGSSATGVIWNAPGVTSALLGTGAAHLVIDRVEVLGAVDGAAVEAHPPPRAHAEPQTLLFKVFQLYSLLFKLYSLKKKKEPHSSLLFTLYSLYI